MKSVEREPWQQRHLGVGRGRSTTKSVHSEQGKRLYPVERRHEFVPMKERGKTNFGG